MPSDAVMVGISGGVDSAVAASRLIDDGFEVAGLFMKNWDEDDGTEYCTAEADLADAERVCARLGIELHTANFAAEYWDSVFESFLADYQAGLTPNPDVLCNREIKFNLFIDYAMILGYPLVATGHYADRSDVAAARYRLLTAADDNKDQTYFLQAVPSIQLEKCLFPLADLPKRDVRATAARLGLDVHDKKDSTGICFIGERRFSDFLSRYVTGDPGRMVDTDGVSVGEHQGLAFYTIGQRQGLGIGGLKNRPERPWYVAAKDIEANELVVTQDESALLGSELIADSLNWISTRRPEVCAARIRHRQRLQSCRVEYRDNDTIRVRFDTPQRAITPGQYVALYEGNECLGGGRIRAGG